MKAPSLSGWTFQSESNGSTKNQLKHTRRPVSSFFRNRAEETDCESESCEPSDQTDQPEGLRLSAVSLPAVIGVFCRSNLKTTGEIKKVSELGVWVAHFRC